MRACIHLVESVLLTLVAVTVALGEENAARAEAHQLNGLVTELLNVSEIAAPGGEYHFTRASDGWVFVSATSSGGGAAKIFLDDAPESEPLITRDASGGAAEAFRFVTQGAHKLRVRSEGDARIDSLVVRAVPELIHCGLGFDPQIKSYGRYDMEFLKKDILPNVTTLIVPSNVELPQPVVDDWHRQGKRFIAEVGISSQAETADDHIKYWTGVFDRAPFLDGIIINEFIVNAESTRPGENVSPERQQRIEREQHRHKICEEAFRQMKADERYKSKAVIAYVGGSGKKLNQQMIGPTFVRTLIDCDYRIALERYIFEVSSQEKSDAALQLLVDGISDWEAKEPGVKQQMVIAFGLFSMPPGGINKQPNVDYHVWMDQQMNRVANNPALAGMGGLEWWTTILADEETTRFVGRLYRHYAIEGKHEMLTHDPLYLPHIENADFERGTEGWTITPAEEGSIAGKSFPRYGRIEGRYMGLGRPADPEHIGDTFLWMKRSEKGPNTFSQTIKNLEPGRLYSMKMFSCDYRDLTEPKTKTMEEATGFLGRVTLDAVEIDEQRSFNEIYSSTPEPKIPVWITYHWKVFRPRGTTATLTVSDWASDEKPTGPFGQEQTFNFVEIQPYHE